MARAVHAQRCYTRAVLAVEEKNARSIALFIPCGDQTRIWTRGIATPNRGG